MNFHSVSLFDLGVTPDSVIGPSLNKQRAMLERSWGMGAGAGLSLPLILLKERMMERKGGKKENMTLHIDVLLSFPSQPQRHPSSTLSLPALGRLDKGL